MIALRKNEDIKNIWNANLYDTKHAFVSNFGDNLIELLAPQAGEKILDVGCGTGDLAKQLYDKSVDIVGIDQSENMIKQAKKKYPNIKFLVRDATNLEYRNEFDAVFSNATLHWVKPAKQSLNCIYQSLKRNGRFIAEFGGEGNIQILIHEIIKQLNEAGFNYNIEQLPWYFPSIGEYASLMEAVGFKVIFAQHFDRPTPLEGSNGLRNWIKMFGSYMFAGINESTKNEIITKIENNLRKIIFKNGHWIADYTRIRVIGVKD